jgi:hypothetical protein
MKSLNFSGSRMKKMGVLLPPLDSGGCAQGSGEGGRIGDWTQMDHVAEEPATASTLIY